MNKEMLKTKYAIACDAYLREFCKKHGYDYSDAYWVGDQTGGIADINEIFVSMQTIIDDIELDAPEDELTKWYDYCVEMSFLGAETTPNFSSWVKGCPRKTKEQIEAMKESKKKIEELKDMLFSSANDKNF